MKKSAVLLLIALNVGFYFFLQRKIQYKVAPLLREEVPLFDNKTLLMCKKLRTLHAKNFLGDSKIEASQGLIRQDHTLKATSVFIELQCTNKKIIFISGNEAIFSPNSNTFLLSGDVEVKQNTASLYASELFVNKNKKLLIAKKNVLFKSLYEKISSDIATIDLQDNTVILSGKVSSVFNTKREHKPQQ